MATQNAINNSTGTLTITSLTAGVAQTNSSGVVSSSNGSNGQVLIGGGSAPAWANITSSGSTVTVTNGANTINLEVASPTMSFVDVTGTSASMAVNTIYMADNAGLVTLTLPTTAAQGTRISVCGGNSGLSTGSWKIAQNSGQSIAFGSSTTTVGATGSLQATNQWDSITLICTVANTKWTVLGGAQGNITVA
jgi:hypothetical protein